MLIAISAVLLFFFSKAYILYMIVIFVALGVLFLVLLKRDSHYIETKASIEIEREGSRDINCLFTVRSNKALIATKSIVVEFELYNKMFDITMRQKAVFELRDKWHTYKIPVETKLCGELSVKCISVYATDLSGIWRIRIPSFNTECVVVYPDNVKMNIILDDVAAAASMEDGIMQNRKGTDASEMFDFKEYKPGDDVRTIHWKLSEKMDSLIVREASEPSHYEAALIPDFGHVNVDEDISSEELAKAVSVTAALGEQLAMQGISFCIMVPTDDGMYVHEIDSINEYDRMIAEIMQFRIRDKAGDGLKLFMSEHMEEYFTRLVIVSAGTYKQEFNGLEHQVGITVVSVTQDIDKLHEISRDGARMVEVPLKNEEDGYRIVI